MKIGMKSMAKTRYG